MSIKVFIDIIKVKSISIMVVIMGRLWIGWYLKKE
jgi:hypothetical protein